jgi:hypothetical protein
VSDRSPAVSGDAPAGFGASPPCPANKPGLPDTTLTSPCHQPPFPSPVDPRPSGELNRDG